MKALYFLALFFPLVGRTQQDPETAIRKILDDQIRSWNAGNLNSFMQGYWKNDSLMFIGKNGVTYGFANTLANYRKNYPDTASMGKLAFKVLHVKKLSAELYFVVGRWMLNRSIGNLSGHYSLVIKMIDGEWKIISDHSS